MRVAITGAAGQLGSELVRAFDAAGWETAALSRPAFRLEHPTLDVAADLVVNAAAWTDVDGCVRDPARAMRLNGVAPGVLAALARDVGARFVQVSTNEVFDGAEPRAYAEADPTHPINPYGASKLAGEDAVRAAYPRALIVRTAWIFGGPRSFPSKILAAGRRAAGAAEPLRVVADEVGNPTPAATLADRIVALVALPAAPSLVHLAGEPPVSRHAWASRVLEEAHLLAPLPMALRDFVRDSTPPPHAVLDTALARSLGLGIEWRTGIIGSIPPE